MTTLTIDRTTESGLPVHPSHRTWREVKRAEGAWFPDDFPGGTCADCGQTIDAAPSEVDDSMAEPCDGWAGDDPSTWLAQ